MSANHPQITGQRQLTVGRVTWRVSEFDTGPVMLIAEAASATIHFSTHFTAEQWAEFQQLIAGVES